MNFIQSCMLNDILAITKAIAKSTAIAIKIAKAINEKRNYNNKHIYDKIKPTSIFI